MPDLSEFIAFVVEKSGIRKPSLVERDVIIHGILKGIISAFSDAYLFKGGSCLVKCYFGYYRFSVDLDFTWREQKAWLNLGKKALRRRLVAKAERFGSVIESIASEAELDFKCDLKNKNYVEFGSGSRMATFKLWRGSELIKIQVNFVEKLLFPHKNVTAKTLLADKEIQEDEKAYFEEFLEFYRPMRVAAYSLEEILCEKIRAILTRQAMKLRDLYDVFMIEKAGVRTEKLKEEIVEKIKAALRFKRYRQALMEGEKIDLESVAEDPFELEMFVVKPEEEFYIFLRRLENFLKEIVHETLNR